MITSQTVTVSATVSADIAKLAAEELLQAVRQIRDDEGNPSVRALQLEEFAAELLRAS